MLDELLEGNHNSYQFWLAGSSPDLGEVSEGRRGKKISLRELKLSHSKALRCHFKKFIFLDVFHRFFK
jgi:hypothetical protein